MNKHLQTIARFLAALAGLFFFSLGAAFLLAPGPIGAQMGIVVSSNAGYSTIRADLGGPFLALGLSFVLATTGRRTSWTNVAILVVSGIVTGRLLGLIVDGPARYTVQALAIEVLLLAIAVMLGLVTRASGGSGSSRWMAVTGGLLLLAGIGVAGMQRQIGLVLMRRYVETGFSRDVLGSLPAGLNAGLCGSGAPLPDPNRAGPCVFVYAANHLYVVDAGEDSPRKMGLMGIPPGRIDAVLLTHFHSDHIGGLGEMMLQRWTGAGHTQPLDVFGPPGVESVVDGFNAAYRLDSGYRVTHHGAATLPPSGAGGVARPFALPSEGDCPVILQQDGLTIRAFAVNHSPVSPAVGYRFDYGGRSVVVSGDTAPSENLVKNANHVDVLFHEGLQTSMVSILHEGAVRHDRKTMAKITADIPPYHTTPEQAARIASEAGVRRLVFYHIIPALPFSFMNAAYLGDAGSIFRGPITVGKDGLLVSLPSGTDKILLRELL